LCSSLLHNLPWFHNCVLLDKVKVSSERVWYIERAIQNGWSRRVLVLQIESGLFLRQGKAITNFHATLPPPQSDLAQQILKDPYNFDFLTLANAGKRYAVSKDRCSRARSQECNVGLSCALNQPLSRGTITPM
jgi:predicted nuclease of restriction endonuclease-like (RecB) superfamily